MDTRKEKENRDEMCIASEFLGKREEWVMQRSKEILLCTHNFMLMPNALWRRDLIRFCFCFLRMRLCTKPAFTSFSYLNAFSIPHPFVLVFLFCVELLGCLLSWCFTLLPLRIASRLCFPVHTAKAASFLDGSSSYCFPTFSSSVFVWAPFLDIRRCSFLISSVLIFDG